jgi:hypothetical protein
VDTEIRSVLMGGQRELRSLCHKITHPGGSIDGPVCSDSYSTYKDNTVHCILIYL